MLKNSILGLTLGGAAVHRCDNRLVLSPASAAEGDCGKHKVFLANCLAAAEQLRFLDERDPPSLVNSRPEENSDLRPQASG